MKRCGIIITILVFVLSISLFLHAKNNDVHLKIPVRIFGKDAPLKDLSKSDFSISINKKDAEISSLEAVEKAMAAPTAPFRNFVLAFNLFNYGDQVNEGIEYFVENILTLNDKVMVLTPNKVYAFSVDESKEKTIENLKELVNKDCQAYKGERAAYAKSLRDTIGSGRLPTVPGEDGTLGTTAATQFLNTYQREWLTFRNRFLLPDVNKFKAVADYFFGKDGDKWFINFQQRDIIPEFEELRKKINSLRDFISSLSADVDQTWGPMLSKQIRELEKSLLLSDDFPQTEIEDILLKSDITYHVILFKSKTSAVEAGSQEETSPDYEDILKSISKTTGGSAVTTTDLKDGLLQLSQHKDQLYYLNIPVETITNLTIDIKVTKDSDSIHYKSSFSPADIKNQRDTHSAKVKIDKVSVKNKVIQFSLSNFSTDKSLEDKSQSLLEVRICVINENGDVVYSGSNEMKPFQDKITVTLPPVDRLSGKNMVYILAEDKIANMSSIFSGDFVF